MTRSFTKTLINSFGSKVYATTNYNSQFDTCFDTNLTWAFNIKVAKFHSRSNTIDPII